MNYNFFADKADKLAILEFIFKETDLKVYDHDSSYGQEISEYRNVEEILSKFDLEKGNKFSVTFQLWAPRHAGRPIFRKIDLDPKRCNGYTFRYATNGWGLIQLYYSGIENNSLSQSTIAHFTEKGASANEKVSAFNDEVNNWNWKEIKSTSGKLKYHIHNKLAVRKIGSCGVLKGADNLVKLGVKLI